MQLVFATHNIHKFNEVKLLLPNTIELLNLNDIQCNKEIEETENTIEGNAILKANYIYNNYKLPCFADDTGLEVNALNGEPGVSARYAGKENNSEANIKKLLKNLEGITNRAAQFKTVIALKTSQEQLLFTGIVQGSITTQKKGTGGFGYDAVFTPKGYSQTFAELPLNEKNKIGHRGKAITKLIIHLNKIK